MDQFSKKPKARLAMHTFLRPTRLYTKSHFKRRPFGSASFNVIWQLLLYNR